MDDSSPPSAPPRPAVRVRRATVAQPSTAVTRTATNVPTTSPPTTTTDSSPATASTTANTLQPSGSTGRKRGYTMTERLFSAYDAPPGDVAGRQRSSSNASRSSSIARGTPAVQIAIRGRSPSVSSQEAGATVPVEAPRQGSVGRGRLRSVSPPAAGLIGRLRAGSGSDPVSISDEHHAQDEVDLLEVMDQSVSTTTHLANIQSAFFPSVFTRPPVCELGPPSPIPEEPEETEEAGHSLEHRTTSATEGEEVDPLDAHLAKLLKKQKQKAKAREIMRGIWTFLKTPLGIAAAIYGALVVFWGAGLVLLLIIPMNSYDKKLWVEIASQILTGLFTITSLLPLPWRLMDWYHVFIIWLSARITRKRRAKLGYAPLRDPNDLPDPGAEYYVSPGGEKLSGPRPLPSTAPAPISKKKSKQKAGGASLNGGPSTDRSVELSAMESKAGSDPLEEEEASVLTEKEAEKLRRAQIKYGRSQTWYRPHTTPTHHAFPVSAALWISICMTGNSVFQAMLCGTMWGMNRWDRPPWTTGCLIPLSFGCGIAAAILIWRCSEATKRKNEVSISMWKILKEQEEELAKRRKEATERRAAEKAAKGHHSHHASRVQTETGVEG